MTEPSSGLRSLLPPAAREQVLRQLNRVRALFLPEPFRTVVPFTMVGIERLRNLDRLVRHIDEDAIPGDVVECGVFNGGSGALLAGRAWRSALNRHTWLLDSFAGMPAPSDHDGPEAARFTALCQGSIDNVRRVLALAGVPEDRVSIIVGWFEDTIPGLPVGQIGLLHVDADWYESCRIVLDHFYDKVSSGGYVVFDDYGYWQGCRDAVDEFFSERALTFDLVPVDGIGVYFRKDV